ncbi:hypothetical protein FWK35_00005138 [Aphis craccivora]|uniref:Uncharacterized protein n=1 Tax=Aphis craccivora TaxID=307492 RepID=A0A6G0Z9W4_APHCR|nr:hypothetical protein FWK35_00005138 [Aphis craccivora]
MWFGPARSLRLKKKNGLVRSVFNSNSVSFGPVP